jgi:hypothetical protein
MPEALQRKRFSFWGTVSVFVIGVVIYLFMQGGHIFWLYAVATTFLCILLFAVCFDLGIKKKQQ